MSLVPFLPIIGNVIEKIFPDKEKADEAKYRLIELQQKGELTVYDGQVQIALAQAGINAEQAKHTNWFVAGMRPATGWVCTCGLAYQFILQPVLAWASLNFGWIAPPILDTGVLISMLGGILGLGAYRTYEKQLGVNHKH